MTESTINDFIKSPKTASRPVFAPNKNEPSVIIKSVNKRAIPIFKLEYFLKIIAKISVPPVLPLQLNKMADPMAGNKTAKKSSKRGSSVRGFDNGNKFSKTINEQDNVKVPRTVFMLQSFPTKIKPKTSITVLITVAIMPTDESLK